MAEDIFTDIIANKKMLKKIRNNELYAQNLYAGLCNNVFQKSSGYGVDWHRSWRFIASTIATLRNQGDYLDFYCTGISELPEDDLMQKSHKCYVRESVLTEEILSDLQSLGWSLSKNRK